MAWTIGAALPAWIRDYLNISATPLRRRLLPWLLLLSALFPLTASSALPPSDTALQRIPGHVLPALQRATLLPQVDAAATDSRPITLTFILRRDNQAAFERYLHDVYDPASASYRRFLDQKALADRFGPSAQTYDAVRHYLRDQGFELLEESANRLTISARATRHQAEQALDVHIRDYALGESRFRAIDSDPALPNRIAPSVQAIAGLSDLARPHGNILYTIGVFICKLATPTEGKDANGNVKRSAEAKANLEQCKSFVKQISKYNGPDAVDPPGWEELDGTGQTIGLIEFDTFQMSDVADYLTLMGRQATQLANVSEVKVNGGATAGPNQAEVLLDIDTLLSTVPGAKIVVYDGPFSGAGSSFQSLFNAAINGGSTIISNSWAYCEDQTTAADVQSIDAIFQSAAAAGITILNGAGDSGSTCLDGSPNTVAVPADSPSATAVGAPARVLPEPAATTT